MPFTIMFAFPDNKNTWKIDQFYVLLMTEHCVLIHGSLGIVTKVSTDTSAIGMENFLVKN